MKKLFWLLLFCMIAVSCTKNKSSKNKNSVITSYSVNLNVAGKVYNSSNSSVYNNSSLNYQWDGLSIYFTYPTCSASSNGEYYQVMIWDTAGGAITNQELLQFDMPGTKSVANYFSPYVEIYFLDSLYSGTAVVSGSISKNGNNTCNGNFSLQGMVVSSYGIDSVAFSASGTFTNMPYY